MNKIKKLLLGLSILFTIIMGIIMVQISDQLSKYNQVGEFTIKNEFFDKFCFNLQDKMIYLWISLGIVIALLIIQLLSEFKKKN